MPRETDTFKTTFDVMDQYIQKCRDFMDDWLLFNQILSGYASTGINKPQYESQFLKVKSKLAREHGVLKDRLGPDFRFSQDVLDVVFSSTTLEAVYAQSEVALKKLQSNWHRAFISINETLGALEEKRRRAEAGERVTVGGITFHIRKSKPIPKRKIALGSAAVMGVATIAFTVYFMRAFLGFWAPAAGEGINVTENMTDEQKVQTLLAVMKEAVESEDIDRIMTAISDKYSDEGGRGKTETRVFLQGFKTAGQMKGLRYALDNSQVTIEGDTGIVRGIDLIAETGTTTIALAIAREGDKWMVTSIGGL
ncbi:MAG: nuclear transport factor 2 family protein [Candidatus Hydrogenedentes bacterium]|nr:nuclear transport factor 2 family protein [Candidatus Hydrogenedentota bacterium]